MDVARYNVITLGLYNRDRPFYRPNAIEAGGSAFCYIALYRVGNGWVSATVI